MHLAPLIVSETTFFSPPSPSSFQNPILLLEIDFILLFPNALDSQIWSAISTWLDSSPLEFMKSFQEQNSMTI